jgi:hypothetical protein
MPILNYTTKIEVSKTVGEIQEILGRAGAHAVLIEYKDKSPVALNFQIELQPGRAVTFRLPARWEGVYKVIKADPAIPAKLTNADQARRVAWRIVKEWTQAQLALVEAGAAELSEVFLPYAVNPQTGHTLFEDFKTDKLLPEGNHQ